MTQHLEKNYHKNLLHSQRRLIYSSACVKPHCRSIPSLPGSNHIFERRRPLSVEFRTLPCPIMPRKSSSPAKKAPSKKGLVPLKPVSPFCEGLLKSLGDDPSRVVRYCSSSLGTSSRARIRLRGLNIHLFLLFFNSPLPFLAPLVSNPIVVSLSSLPSTSGLSSAKMPAKNSYLYFCH